MAANTRKGPTEHRTYLDGGVFNKTEFLGTEAMGGGHGDMRNAGGMHAKIRANAQVRKPQNGAQFNFEDFEEGNDTNGNDTDSDSDMPEPEGGGMPNLGAMLGGGGGMGGLPGMGGKGAPQIPGMDGQGMGDVDMSKLPPDIQKLLPKK